MTETTYRIALAESIHCLRYCAEKLESYLPVTDESAELSARWKQCADILSAELSRLASPEPQSLRA